MPGQSSAVRAGRAFVELFADNNKLYKALAAAEARLKAFGSAAVGVGARAAAAGGVALAPLAKAFSDAFNKGADIKRVATQWQLATDTVSGLAGAFNVAGAGMGEFEASLGGLAAKIKTAADAGGLFDEQLASIGRARDLERLPITEQFDKLADALARIPNGAQQALKAQEWFGEAGAKLLPFLREGSEGLAKLRAEAVRTGEVMSAADVEKSAAVWKSLSAIWREAKNTVIDVGAALLPTVENTGAFRDTVSEAFAAVRRWTGANRGLIVTAAQVAAGLAVGGVAVAGIGATVSAAAPAITAAVGGVKLLAAGFALLANPVGLFAAGVTGLGVLFATQTKAGQQMCATVAAGFKVMLGTVQTAWGGIVDSIGAGDLSGAFEIASTALRAEWGDVMSYWQEVWLKFKGGFLKDLHEMAVKIQESGLWKAAEWIGGKAGEAMDAWGRHAAPVAGMMGDSIRAVEEIAAGHAPAPPPAAAAAAAEATKVVMVDPMQLEIDARRREAAKLRERVAELSAAAAGKRERGEGAWGVQIPDFAEIMRQARDAMKVDQDGGRPGWIMDLVDRARAGAAEVTALTDRQKGIFAGPVAQQLGIGDKVATRQLDVAKQQLDVAQAQAKDIAEMKNKGGLVFGRAR